MKEKKLLKPFAINGNKVSSIGDDVAEKKEVVGLDYEEHKKKFRKSFYPKYVDLCKELDMEPKSFERFLVDGIHDPDEKKTAVKNFCYTNNIKKIFKKHNIH